MKKKSQHFKLLSSFVKEKNKNIKKLFIILKDMNYNEIIPTKKIIN